MLSPKIQMASRLPVATFFLCVFLQLIAYMFFAQSMGYYIEPGDYLAGRQSLYILTGLFLVFFILVLGKKEGSRWDLGIGVFMLWLMGSFFLWTLISGTVTPSNEIAQLPDAAVFFSKRTLLAISAVVCYLSGLLVIIEEVLDKLSMKNKRETYKDQVSR